MLEAMEFMDRLDKAAQYAEMLENKGWTFLYYTTRTDTAWKLVKDGQTYFMEAVMDDFTGEVTETLRKKAPKAML